MSGCNQVFAPKISLEASKMGGPRCVGLLLILLCLSLSREIVIEGENRKTEREMRKIGYCFLTCATSSTLRHLVSDVLFQPLPSWLHWSRASSRVSQLPPSCWTPAHCGRRHIPRLDTTRSEGHSTIQLPAANYTTIHKLLLLLLLLLQLTPLILLLNCCRSLKQHA